MILPHSSVQAAHTVASRVRERVERHTFPEIGTLTISIGIASFEADDDAAALVKRADRALDGAKAGGRNRVGFVSGDEVEA
ncbi:hypothetical protein BH23DEI1_BH23DEI1_14280 [soil metagenome]